eukprot:CAMPEP_0196689676 /NCGR_PEP_ID=MMETSP1090-20130531/18778_1 /TAXON_ID=37098 /ORGANISM="Isochrysis sp, Strain CCMP1244" /LENGTH=199 /DNA_ID=CAMNT_0042028707 /DNA_START=20 /DNA_END=619 /DNA_ORIENTATION=+
MAMSALSFRRLGAAWRAAPAVAASSRLLCTDALTTPAESGKAVGSVERKPQLDSRAVSAFTGTPKELLDKRVVTIYQPAPGVQNASKGCWKISWDDENTQRWSNPLMGWTSTRDPFSNTPMTLEFHSAEDAIRFVQNNGWKYEVQEPVSQNLALVSKGPRSYANNFTWKGPKTRQSQCGAGNMQSFPELYEPPPPPPKK